MGISERLKPYQQINDQVKEEFKLQMHRYLMAVPYCKNKAVLDSGCGVGNGSFLLSANAQSVLAIDNNQEAIDFANKYYPNINIKYQLYDVCKPLNKSFQVIVSFDVIEHLAKPDEYLSVIDQELAADGLLIISTPNKNVLQLIYPEPNRHHLSEMTRAELKEKLEKRFEIDKIVGQVIDGSAVKIVPELNKARTFIAFCKKK